jgi:hypothetical protein
MAIAATSQVLYDNTRNCVMQFTGIADGNDVENNVVKVDASELTPVPQSLKITEITYDVNGGIVQLSWAADNPVPFVNLMGHHTIDYAEINGMVNAGGDSANGDILLSTLGFEAGSSYSVLLKMVKKFA